MEGCAYFSHLALLSFILPKSKAGGLDRSGVREGLAELERMGHCRRRAALYS